ncbi:MAG: ornithine cyclodeaminase family protein [Candidatus Aquirickettsiella gammari]
MKIIDAKQVNQVLDFPALINALDAGFRQDFGMPQRQVFSLSEDPANHDGFAVLPAWNEDVVGVKAFTYFPDNGKQGLPTLFSKILLFSRQDGTPLAMIDGTSVTYWRTAAVSALASRYLARPESMRMLLLGTGNLALPIVKAHLSEHAISDVVVWGRHADKVQSLLQTLRNIYPHVNFSATSDLGVTAAQVDIIVSATGAEEPLLFGKDVAAGCHVDLLGNHSQDRRECDTELICRSSVYVDYRQNVLKEAGELLIPISEGRFAAADVKADLAELCRMERSSRRDAEEITLFKSVGTALSDLICAKLVLDSISSL